jgi:hypothetical protein
MLRTLSQAVGFGISLAMMLGTAHADVPVPCYPCDEDINQYNWDCVQNFGAGWAYCGDDGPDYIWCCPV